MEAANSSYEAVANANPLRYRGYYLDSETGYYYLQSRYYDPNICRFINADVPEIAQQYKFDINGLNIFAYCCNNPVNDADYDGYYSASKAKAYAEKWWSGHNPNYKSNEGNGGDCANFVSQCLYAGSLCLMSGSTGSSKGWHHYKVTRNKYQISDAWGRAHQLYEWLIANNRVKTEYRIYKNSDVDKAGKALSGKYCAAAIFFAANGNPVRKNINGKIQRIVYKGHAALSGEVIKNKNSYDIFYYAHTDARNGHQYYGKTKKNYSLKAYLKSHSGSAIYVCILK